MFKLIWLFFFFFLENIFTGIIGPGTATTSTYKTVIEFGADFTGTTDSTKAFEETFAATLVWRIPAGKYKIKPPVGGFIIPAGSTIIGDGPARSELILNQKNGALFKCTSFNKIEGFSVINETVPTEGILFLFEAGRNTLKNIEANICFTVIESGSAVSTPTENYFSEIRAHGIVNTGFIYGEKSLQSTLTSSVFFAETSGKIEKPKATMLLIKNNNQALVVSNCEFLGGEFSLKIESSKALSESPRFHRFLQTYFDSGEKCRIEKLAASAFTACWFSTRPNAGLEMINGKNITFDNCEFVNSGNTGCNVEKEAKFIAFTACKFIANEVHGLLVNTEATDITITGCTSTNENELGLAKKQKDGILIQAKSKRVICINNVVGGNVEHGVQVGAETEEVTAEKNPGKPA